MDHRDLPHQRRLKPGQTCGICFRDWASRTGTRIRRFRKPCSSIWRARRWRDETLRRSREPCLSRNSSRRDWKPAAKTTILLSPPRPSLTRIRAPRTVEVWYKLIHYMLKEEYISEMFLMESLWHDRKEGLADRFTVPVLCRSSPKKERVCPCGAVFVWFRWLREYRKGLPRRQFPTRRQKMTTVQYLRIRYTKNDRIRRYY